jgi:retron-type reverse transcriptase
MPNRLTDYGDMLAKAWAERAKAADNLAARLLAGPWTEQDLADGIESVLGPIHHARRRALAVRLASWADGTYPPSPRALTDYLLRSKFFRPLPGRHVSLVLDAPRFAPTRNFADLPIPALATRGELAEWAGVTAGQLEWLADMRRTHGRSAEPRLQHYHYGFIAKSNGKTRLLEAPKPRLKALQRRILHEILDHVPVHRCAHGFTRGRSCLTGAQIHAGEAVVATFDLAQFFPSLGLPRIHGVFRSLGYPWDVARHLARLCTTITPSGVLLRLAAADQHESGLRATYGVPHLPQGAPTSPALANLLAWRLDQRLHGLARSADANFTRYADDLAFSGGVFAENLGRFGKSVETIVREEGFALNPSKTRVMRQDARQHVTGIVVNTHCNVGRAAFDRLKAILHHCVTAGPAGQNRDDVADFRRHLDGRVVWVEHINPRRGAKLRALFDRIDWAAA